MATRRHRHDDGEKKDKKRKERGRSKDRRRRRRSMSKSSSSEDSPDPTPPQPAPPTEPIRLVEGQAFAEPARPRSISLSSQSDDDSTEPAARAPAGTGPDTAAPGARPAGSGCTPPAPAPVSKDDKRPGADRRGTSLASQRPKSPDKPPGNTSTTWCYTCKKSIGGGMAGMNQHLRCQTHFANGLWQSKENNYTWKDCLEKGLHMSDAAWEKSGEAGPKPPRAGIRSQSRYPKKSRQRSPVKDRDPDTTRRGPKRDDPDPDDASRPSGSGMAGKLLTAMWESALREASKSW